VRKERTKGNTGSNKNRLCGYPTNDSEKGYCTLSKEGCSKHIGWEELRKAELVQEKNQLLERLGGLNSDEHILKLRISRRRQASTSEQHRTIVELKGQSVKSNGSPPDDKKGGELPLSPTTTTSTPADPPTTSTSSDVSINSNPTPIATPTEALPTAGVVSS